MSIHVIVNIHNTETRQNKLIHFCLTENEMTTVIFLLKQISKNGIPNSFNIPTVLSLYCIAEINKGKQISYKAKHSTNKMFRYVPLLKILVNIGLISHAF